MMRSKLTALCLAAMMIPGAAAAAERPTGTYLGAGAGVSFADDTDISGTGINASAEHDTGYAGVLPTQTAFVPRLNSPTGAMPSTVSITSARVAAPTC